MRRWRWYLRCFRGTALTESDCVLLDTAAEQHRCGVVAVVSKIDVHRGWRDVLTSNRDRLAARVPLRPGALLARLPHLSWASHTWTAWPPPSRNSSPIRCRAAKHVACGESRLLMVARRSDRWAQSAGRRHGSTRAPATAHGSRGRGHNQSSEHHQLRAQIQHARVKLSYLPAIGARRARRSCRSTSPVCPGRTSPWFAAYTRGQVQEVVAEVG